MKKMIALCLLSIPAFAMAEGAEKVLSQHVQTTPYVESITDGAVTMAQAWEGEKLIKLDTGECRKVEHSHLRVIDLGHGVQGVNVQVEESSVACPA